MNNEGSMIDDTIEVYANRLFNEDDHNRRQAFRVMCYRLYKFGVFNGIHMMKKNNLLTDFTGDDNNG